jgi:serine protease inhibitor
MSASQRLSLPIATLLVSGLLLSGTRAGAEEEINFKPLGDGNTTFALDIYEKIKTGRDNLFFSPYSI